MEMIVEQQERTQVEAQLNALGFKTIYGGGRASKGHGFWIKEMLNSKNQKDMPGSTFHTIEECHDVITRKGDKQ